MISVNKWAYRKLAVEMCLSGFLFVFFLNVTFGLQASHLKTLKIIQYDF